MRKVLILIFFKMVFADMIIKPIPEKIDYNKQKAKLGMYLFTDPRLSADKKISCMSCHKPSEGWADRRKVSIGVFGRKGRVNSPTVLNAVFNFRQFWNGRAKDLKEQVFGPLHTNYEMDIDKKEAEKTVNSIAFYKKIFKKIYHSDYITADMIADAIAEFEKSLITPDCKYDLYLKGKAKLSPKELKGKILFKSYGCITCHNGINIGGNSYQKMGLIIPYKNCVDDRYEITRDPADKCVYKVPTLRNIELTAPYFHDGSSDTLKKAIEKMGYYNLGIELKPDEIDAIEAFLKTFTGKQPDMESYR